LAAAATSNRYPSATRWAIRVDLHQRDHAAVAFRDHTTRRLYRRPGAVQLHDHDHDRDQD